MTKNYEVGYKRPPKSTQFQKGQSGNPKGRPKGAPNVSTIITALMSTRRPVRIDGRGKMMSGAEIMLQQQAKKAMNGDHKATQFIIGLLQANEAKAVLSAAMSAAADASAVSDETLSETEVAILAHHYRSELSEGGLDERAIELALAAFELAPKECDR